MRVFFRLGVDLFDFDRRHGLTMVLGAHMAGFVAKLHAADLCLLFCADNRGFNRCSLYGRLSDVHVGAFGNHEHFVEGKFLSVFNGKLFHLEHVALGDLILLAASFDDGDHIKRKRLPPAIR